LGSTQQGVARARMTVPRNAGYPTRVDVKRFQDRLFETLRNQPDFEIVGAAQGVPFVGWNVASYFEAEGMPALSKGEVLDAHYQYVTHDFFKTMGVRLTRGRWWNATDRDSLHPTVLINERMAARAFLGKDPVGQRLR